ncbi:MAG: hypothetical protein UY96_C0003G0068 [Parcubacteria group bacterium GW2011_GWB1_56_8]|nr:MAG: hypothetical protein UY96_C0003G0068 [Parcubacteria group bacterium GW2011_GWB1_56_8]
MSRCHQCQRDPDEYDRELRSLTEALAVERFEIGRYRNILDELRAEIAAARECLPRIGGPMFDAQVTGNVDLNDEAADALREAGLCLDAAVAVLAKEHFV